LGAWGVPLAAFVCVYNVHMYVQGMTFRADGAMGVQLVNAVRGCVTNMVFWVLGAGGAGGGGAGGGRAVGLLSGMVAGIGGVLWVERAKDTNADAKKKRT